MHNEDIEHPSQPDPLARHEGPRATPQAPQQPPDSAAIINATKEYRDLRKLAELAGGPVDQLKEI